jgi:hypothetical protein
VRALSAVALSQTAAQALPLLVLVLVLVLVPLLVPMVPMVVAQSPLLLLLPMVVAESPLLMSSAPTPMTHATGPWRPTLVAELAWSQNIRPTLVAELARHRPG